jgi:hypothetical protein
MLQRISHHHLHFLIRVKDKFSKRRSKICQTKKTGLSSFGRIENVLSEEDDCSISSSDVNDDDDTDDEYDEQELLVEFKKLISKHMKL